MSAPVRAWMTLAAAALMAACAGDSPTAGTATGDLATITDGLDTASDMASAPDTAGLMLGAASLPRIPAGLEGFRCAASPTIAVTKVCGRTFPSSLSLSWADCNAHGPRESYEHHDGHDGDHDGGVKADAGAAATMTSSGTVSITSTVTTDPAGSCTNTTKVTIVREATFAITTTASDGSREVNGTVTTTSTRDPGARTFSNAEAHDLSITERDEGGATISSRHLEGDLTTTFAIVDGVGARTTSGTLSDTRDGATATVTITDLVRPGFLVCRWPTSGTITRTADGATHTLVFGPTCGAATLDATAVTLPTASLGFHRRSR